jgi:hypothetical protein
VTVPKSMQCGVSRRSQSHPPGRDLSLARRVREAVRVMQPVLALFLLLAATLGQFGAAAGARAEGAIKDIRLLPHENGVRMVLDLGTEVPFSHRTLDNPPRLVIDLPELAWAVPAGSNQALRMVEGLRFGTFRDDMVRLVLDIDRPFEITKILELPPRYGNGYRVVTDLAPLPVGTNASSDFDCSAVKAFMTVSPDVAAHMSSALRSWTSSGPSSP